MLYLEYFNGLCNVFNRLNSGIFVGFKKLRVFMFIRQYRFIRFLKIQLNLNNIYDELVVFFFILNLCSKLFGFDINFCKFVVNFIFLFFSVSFQN